MKKKRKLQRFSYNPGRVSWSSRSGKKKKEKKRKQKKFNRPDNRMDFLISALRFFREQKRRERRRWAETLSRSPYLVGGEREKARWKKVKGFGHFSLRLSGLTMMDSLSLFFFLIINLVNCVIVWSKLSYQLICHKINLLLEHTLYIHLVTSEFVYEYHYTQH